MQYPKFITIAQAIEFHQEFGQSIQGRVAIIEQMQEGEDKEFETLSFEIDHAYDMISFFTGANVDQLKEDMPVVDAIADYATKLQPLFIDEASSFKTVDYLNENWQLPNVELKPDSVMTFGEFIDSKVIVQSVIDAEGCKWEMLLYVAAIFFRKEHEQYSENFLYDNSERLKELSELPLSIAAGIGQWFNDFSNYLEEFFPVFAESKLKSSPHLKLHMNDWGWVNFLKSIAATKVFDIANSGMNSIDCVRRAKAYEVLVLASEEKQYNEAYSLDMEAAYKNP